jgi:hypothetical protein
MLTSINPTLSSEAKELSFHFRLNVPTSNDTPTPVAFLWHFASGEIRFQPRRKAITINQYPSDTESIIYSLVAERVMTMTEELTFSTVDSKNDSIFVCFPFSDIWNVGGK